MSHIINIKNLTVIINLNRTSAASYLNFIDETKKIKQEDHSKIISSSKQQNDYLIIYVDNKPTEFTLTKLLLKSLIENNIDFVAIDELFPDNNSHLLGRVDIPSSKDWVLKCEISSDKSTITVE